MNLKLSSRWQMALAFAALYLVCWALTATMGIAQMERRVDQRIEDVTGDQTQKVENLDELVAIWKSGERPGGYPYYFEGSCYAPFWIRFEIGAGYDGHHAFNDYDVGWFFGHMINWPED